ncbi:MAG: hypothetical protein ACRDHE_01485 [Ktedonobacterales bacterium]
MSGRGKQVGMLPAPPFGGPQTLITTDGLADGWAGGRMGWRTDGLANEFAPGWPATAKPACAGWGPAAPPRPRRIRKEKVRFSHPLSSWETGPGGESLVSARG